MTRGHLGGKGVVLEDCARQLASQRISGALSKEAGKALGLDEVTVTGNLFNFGVSWGPQLVISKSIFPRTKITYSMNVGHINDQSFRISYQLNPKWSLAGETDENENSAQSIIYDLRFK
jgi:autotransporter translocation and assembly factor TamB